LNICSQLSDTEKAIKDAAVSSSTAESTPWSEFIVPLLSSFAQLGLNGNHNCLVFELMGCSVADLLLQQPLDAHFSKPIPGPFDRGLKIHEVKCTLRQMLAGLVVLHSRGLIRGDLHIGNALFPCGFHKQALMENLPFSCRKIPRMR
jgi:serine/threonine protein kinase